MVDRTHRELTGEDIARIADTYDAWRNRAPSSSRQGARPKSKGLTSYARRSRLLQERHPG